MQDIFKYFGIYLHVPFCAQNCDYCRFYKRAPTLLDMDNYVETIAAELKLHARECGGTLPRPDTMFWGGGTPSTLAPAQLGNLVKLFEGNLNPALEWTVEVAPTSATHTKLKILKDSGVSRISMGVQSFNQKKLDSLGRKHTLKSTLDAIDRVAGFEFKNFSIDLIFGAQGETLDDWQADIRQAAAMPVNHISAYCLEFESATSCCAGNLTDKELEKRANDAEFFETAMNLLPELGFEQYEISNYARSKSARCLHNLSTWNMAQWLGLGAAAASQWRGIRRRNSSDFIKWRNGVLDGLPNYEDIVALDDEELFSSALIFGLRMSDGVNFNSIKKRFPKANSQKYHDAIMGLCAQGMMTICDDSTVKLTRQGTLMADAIAVELL